MSNILLYYDNNAIKLSLAKSCEGQRHTPFENTQIKE